MGGLVVKFPFNMEDRVNVALRDFNNRTDYSIIINTLPEDVTSRSSNTDRKIEYYFNINHKLINQFIHFLNDVETVMGVPIEFRYCTSKREAYTSSDDARGLFEHKWLKIAR